jgi:hypothetical protein
MSRIEIVCEGHTLEINRDMIDVTAIHEPDPGWTFTDTQGHEHGAVEQGPDGSVRYPSLLKRVIPHECDGYCEEEGCPRGWVCQWCYEVITPGTRAGRTRYIPGMTRYLIDGEPVSEQAARDFVTARQRELNARHGSTSTGAALQRVFGDRDGGSHDGRQD